MANAGTNPAMLAWARKRAGFTLSDVQAKAAKKPWIRKLPDWEAGTDGPTFEQARTLAKLLRVPLGYLFLVKPPADSVQLPDLRTVGDRQGRLGLDLADVVMDAQRKQEWLHEYRSEHGVPPVSFVGASSINDPPKTVAERLRLALRITDEERDQQGNWEDYLRLLIARTEEAGVLVLQSSTVGVNTHRPLDVDDFRGFALMDKLAPTLFINTQDVKPARIFTLLHEIAHLAIAASGVSNAPLDDSYERPLRSEEAFCNKVAAEFLVPEQDFFAAWSPDHSLASNASRLARRYKVSPMMIARRAFDGGLVTGDDYWPFIRRCIASAQARREKDRQSDGGPSPLAMARIRNGKAFTTMVVRAAQAGELLYREAASLLNVKPVMLDKLGR